MEFPQHSQQVLSALHSQRQRGFLCDCTVQVGSSRFLAHRAVLASCSPFFHMFYSDSPAGNSTSSCVTLDSDIVTSAAFGLLLDFVYEGVLQLDQSPPVEDILAAASFLHMNEVVRVCKRRLQRRGPLAEADSTRSEESALRKVPEAGAEGDHAAEPLVAMVPDHSNPVTIAVPLSSVLEVTNKSQMECVKSEQRTGGGSSKTQTPLSLDLADTTQPGMDILHLPPPGELVQSQTNVPALVPAKGKNSSQDTSSLASSLVPPSSSQQHPDPPAFFQELQDSMGNFVEDVPTCGVCGKTFSCTYTLRRHAIVHTRERPYECRYCYRSYTQSGDLYRHIRKAHDQTLPAKRSKADTEGPLPQPPPRS
ncbi:hypothetical protein CRENBAI_018335 [Crenichthys baileyi]|uniref:Zinc finger and BTB domain-containing protein 3 n=1 Tax=Crenichthys baileyi TaxID=28760 RepID=A0AAV9S6D5_9TELE